MRHIILDTSTALVRARLGIAVNTTDVIFTSHYYNSTDTDIAELSEQGVISGTSNVTLVPAPTTPPRVVTEISWFNADDVTHTITLEYFNGTDARIIFSQPVEPGDTIYLSDISIRGPVGPSGGVTSVNGATGVVILNWDDLNDVPAYPSDGYDYILVQNDGVNTWELYVPSAGSQTLAQTLVLGNTTGGTDIEVTNTDSIYFPDTIRTLFTFDGSYSFGKVAGVFSWLVDGFSVATTAGVNIFQALNSGIVKLGASGLTSRLQLWNTSGHHVEHDSTAATAARAFIYPDGDVDFTGGADGQVLTQQADGSWIPETPASGVTDHALLSNLDWLGSGHTSYSPKVLAGFDEYGETEEVDLELEITTTSRSYTQGQGFTIEDLTITAGTPNTVDWNVDTSNMKRLILNADAELQVPTGSLNVTGSIEVENDGGFTLTFAAGLSTSYILGDTPTTTDTEFFLITYEKRGSRIWLVVNNQNP